MYETDLTDCHWQVIQEILPPPQSEAEFATVQLRAGGFAGPAVQLATRKSLLAQHLPSPEAAPE